MCGLYLSISIREKFLTRKNFLLVLRLIFFSVKMIKQIELFAKESFKVVLTNGRTLSVSKSGHNLLKEITCFFRGKGLFLINTIFFTI